MLYLFIALSVIGMILYSSLSWGFVLFKFWSWFVLPVFGMLPEITWWQAVGLMFVIQLFQARPAVAKETDNTSNFVNVLLTPWLLLVIAWVIGSLWVF